MKNSFRLIATRSQLAWNMTNLTSAYAMAIPITMARRLRTEFRHELNRFSRAQSTPLDMVVWYAADAII